MEQLVNAVIKPDLYYNTAYHAYADAVMYVNKKTDFPVFPEYTWADLENISGWDKTSICRQVGFENLPLLIVHATLFFTFPEKYKMQLPEYYDRLSLAFNRKP